MCQITFLKSSLFIVFLSLFFSQQLFAIEKDNQVVYIRANKIKQAKYKSNHASFVITKEDISRIHPNSINELLQFYAGINTISSGVGRIYSRGADSRYTKILIDQVEIRNPTSIGGEARLELIDVDSIERIEITKGSQSVLYGTDAIAGVINITTKKKSYFKTTIGSNKKDINATAFSKLANWQSSLKVNYSLFDNPSSKIGIEKDAITKKNVSLSLSRKKDNYSTNLSAIYNNADINFDNINDSKDIEIINQTIFDFKDTRKFYDRRLHLKNQITFQKMNRKYKLETASNSEYQGDNFNLTTEIIYYKNKNLSFISGFLLNKERINNLPSKVSASRNNFDLYGNMFFSGQSFFSSFGTRFSKFSNQKMEQTFDFSIGKKYKFAIIKLLFSTGFKVASMYQTYSIYKGDNLNAETSTSSELSIILPFSKEKINLNIYYLKYKNFIDYDLVTSKYTNFAQVESKGLEVSAVLKKWHNFFFSYSFEYNIIYDTKMKKQLVNRPKIKDTFITSYQITKKLKTSLAFLYKSKRIQFDGSSLKSFAQIDFNILYKINQKSNCSLSLNNVTNNKIQEIKGYNILGPNFHVRYQYKF